MNRARPRATYDDLVKVPEHMVAELIDGQVVTTPRPAPPHAHAESGIGSDLWGRFNGPPGDPERPGGWWILIEPELHLQSDVLVPDVAGWRRERMPALPRGAAFEQAPDWACEVVSPRTAAIDRGRKMEIYARERVTHLWMVDALARTLENYHLHDDRWVAVARHGGSETVRAEPFAAAAIDIGRWWVEAALQPRPRPRARRSRRAATRR